MRWESSGTIQSWIGERRGQPWAGSIFPPAVTDFADTSVKAMTHGSLPVFTQLWMVPRWTYTSPALRCTFPTSSSISISPDMTTA